MAGREQQPSGRRRSLTGRIWSRVADFAQGLAGEVPAAPEPVPAQPPEAVLELVRSLGIALSRAGEPADRVTHVLDDVSRM